MPSLWQSGVGVEGRVRMVTTTGNCPYHKKGIAIETENSTAGTCFSRFLQQIFGETPMEVKSVGLLGSGCLIAFLSGTWKSVGQ
jgi:hypothetical protein